MKKCNACGKENDDALTECESCNIALSETYDLMESDSRNYDNIPRKEYPYYKESILKKIGVTIYTVIIYIFIGWLFIGGWIHSFSKHGVGWGVASVVVPPIGWYRSIEFFWHNDFAGVDWNKRLEYNSQACLGLIGFSGGNEGEKAAYSTQVTGAIEELSKQIGEYPKDKRQYLKDLSKSYILYMESFWLDFMAFVNNKKSKFEKSDVTLKHEKVLLEYPFLKEQIETINKLFYEKQKDTSTKMWSDMTEEEFKKMIEYCDLAFRSIKRNMHSTYKNIFNEELQE